ncbi:oligoribonuclease [Pseudoclavibacter sp. CFCC 13796]|uniref:oligoribonuclease n=1 Tax=Pseudoclavibacter sp. CFCC 13796 TaxID=2615179 RepID=UPI001CE47739|nr:oligoribonuclease [Pseudoclavibacter sp. CFCC 13796]
MPHGKNIIWIDCEMTGLDLHRDALIEIAVIATDENLNVCDAGIDLIIKPSADALAGMNDFVRNMHTESGLLDELDDGISLAEANDQVMAYVKKHAPRPQANPLAGNSIGTDRGFLARDLPELDEHLSYRNIDVSSLKELARRWFPRAYYHSPEKHGGHRAMADIIESIRELDYYRRTFIVAEPGPTSTEATAACEASETRFASLLQNQ